MKNLPPLSTLDNLGCVLIRKNGNFVAGLPAQPSPSTPIVVPGVPALGSYLCIKIVFSPQSLFGMQPTLFEGNCPLSEEEATVACEIG